ncbi:MAG TPA: DNA replication and repair protein RecF [Bacillota bacterium]
MYLEALRLHAFRNYGELHAAFPPGLVLLTGPNAAGKTNLLEAVHLLCTGFSHRGARDVDMAAWGGSHYAVHGMVRSNGQPVDLVVRFDSTEGKRVSALGTTLRRRADLMDYASAVAFSPDDLRLVKGEPAHRRRYLDRLAALLDRRHAADLAEFRGVLEQRNQLLRDLRARRTGRSLAGLFDEPYLALAARVLARRVAALGRALPAAASALAGLTGGRERLTVLYLEGGDHPHDPLSPGAAADRSDFWLERGRAALESRAREEQERALTLWGPHRDDVAFRIDGRDVRVHASQGQQRSVVLALKRAEFQITGQALGVPPLLLLDDVLSELDPERSAALLGLALEADQALVTAAVDASTDLGPWRDAAAAVYTVAGGRLAGGPPP